jgi:hypothetical protein
MHLICAAGRDFAGINAVRTNRLWLVLAVAAELVTACAPLNTQRSNLQTQSTKAGEHHAKAIRLSPKARLEAIRRAQVWRAVDVGAANLRVGPTGPGAFAPGATGRCDYREKEMGGRTPKFTCVVPPDDELRVKYGSDNGEVFAEVAATRLLWALGFPADRMYPVRVECQGCSQDPHGKPRPTRDLVVFDPAAVERKMPGHLMESQLDGGWSWAELDLVDESAGGAPRAQRDGLKLLAALLQHSDNKPSQQRLYCGHALDEAEGTAVCRDPWMMVQDLGITFGRSNVFNRGTVGSVNFERWSSVPVWAGGAKCVANLAPTQTGSLENPQIGEAGRKFLADLLVQLSDAQLHDLFEVARFSQRRVDNTRPATTEQWVDEFKKKRDQVVARTCPT